MALIPPFFLDCVVAIGLIASDGNSKQWTASGFLYGEMVNETSKPETHEYRVFLVTNRHVFLDHKAVWLRFNTEGETPAKELQLPLEDIAGKRVWFPHPNQSVDIAIVPINTSALEEKKIKFGAFLSNSHVLERKKAIDAGISEGDGAYILGFPMGLVGNHRNYVIVRQGTIARVRDYLSGASNEILIDATIFPGNSGGPVITRPEILSIEGTKSQNAAYLIGVVQGYIPYRDVAISSQTKRPRVIFEENSSLASVVPFDYVREAVQEYIATHPLPIRPSEASELNPATQ